MDQPNKDSEPRRKPKRSDARRTRKQLLEAAGMAFARDGYDGVSLREICREAGVNLGAVKYYFGSKENLYREILIGTHRELLTGVPMPRLGDFSDGESAFRGWMKWFLEVVLIRRAEHLYLGRIAVNELVRPTAIFQELIETVFIRIRSELERIVMSVAGCDLPAETRNHLTNLTLMVGVQHETVRHVLERFGYRRPTNKAECDALAERLSTFILGGMRAVALEASKPANGDVSRD